MKTKLLPLCCALFLVSCDSNKPFVSQLTEAMTNFSNALDIPGASPIDSRLDGAVIRISGGPTIRVKRSGATIDGNPAEQFRCRLVNNTVYLSGFYTEEHGMRTFDYKLAAKASGEGDFRIKLNQTGSVIRSGTAQGYFGNAYYLPWSSAECLTGKKVTFSKP